jgi:hypothetical protein
MADQIFDPRFETLLRDVLSAEVASLPVNVRENQILERAEARRRARARSRLRLLIFGEPTSGLRQLSVAVGAIAVLALAGALAFATLRLDRTNVAGPLPTTTDAWSRAVIETPSGTGAVELIAASPGGLLAIVSDGATRLAVSTDGRKWTLVPDNRHPSLSNPGDSGFPSVVGTDRGFLLAAGNEVWMSERGDEWHRVNDSASDPDLDMKRISALAVGGPGLVSVGGDKAWYSTDGSDWSPAQVPPPPTQYFEQKGYTGEDYSAPTVEMRGLTVVGDTLFAWGSATVSLIPPQELMADRAVPVLWSSNDGRAWSNVLDPEREELFDTVAGGPGGLVAFVNAGEPDVGHPQLVVHYSADAGAWDKVDVLDPRAPWPTNAAPYGEGGDIVDGMPLALTVTSAAASDAGYVAVGSDGVCHTFRAPGEWCQPDEAAVWTSVDGRSWSRLARSDLFSIAEPENPSNRDGAWANKVVAWGSQFVVGGAFEGKPAIWISDASPS